MNDEPSQPVEVARPSADQVEQLRACVEEVGGAAKVMLFDILEELEATSGGGMSRSAFEALLADVKSRGASFGEYTINPRSSPKRRMVRRAERWFREREYWRRRLGLPTPPDVTTPLMLGLIAGGGAIVAFGLAATLIASSFGIAQSLAAGVIFIVLLGAGGLVCRGIGELKSSREWKAVGYMLGASAYLVTAGAALINGIPNLLNSR